MQQSLRAVPFSFLPFCPLSSVRDKETIHSINKIISIGKTNGENRGKTLIRSNLYEKRKNVIDYF